MQRVEEDPVPAMDAPSAPPAKDNAASPSALESAQLSTIGTAPGPPPVTLTAVGRAPDQAALEQGNAQAGRNSLAKTPKPVNVAGNADGGNAGQERGADAMDDLEVLMLYSGGTVPGESIFKFFCHSSCDKKTYSAEGRLTCRGARIIEQVIKPRRQATSR